MKYEYKCRDCDTIWITEHSIHVDNAVEELGLSCPECESLNIAKYLGNYHRPTVIFKGIGWAHKDFALDKLNMPKATRESPEARKRMNELL